MIVYNFMKSNYFLFFLLLFISSSTLHAQKEEGWVTKYDKDGLVIQLRGAKTTEYRAVMTVNADLKSCVALLQDIESHPQFMTTVKSVELLKVYNNKESLVYSVIDMPFPMGDKDLVSKAEFINKPAEKKVIVKLKSLPTAYPAKDYDRMKTADGQWIFETIGDNKTKVTYQLKFDESNAPNWVVNKFVVDNPKEVLLGFANFVKKPKYKNADIVWMR